MPTVTSLQVWALLPVNDRQETLEAIVRVLTEEVENDQFRENPADSSGTASGRLHPPVRSQAGSEESRERHQLTRSARSGVGMGLEEKSGSRH